MARPRNPVPSYLPHKSSGSARAVWTDAAGVRHFRMMPGAYGSSESRSAFTKLLLELESAPCRPQAVQDGLTVAELLLAYLDHAERHYRDADGKSTSEIYEVRIVTRALRRLHAASPAAVFGPLALKAARQGWVKEGRSRSECNRRVGMVKRIFKWGVSEELVPSATYQGLAAVAGLQRGRTPARETDPIGPVADEIVDATLPFLGRHVRGLVEFQRLTGCRPGEACFARRCDIDMTGPVWTYTPSRHKNSWRGRSRAIAVGPKAQEVLKAFFTENAADFLFSPQKAVEEQLAARSAARKTPRYPSHMARNAEKRVKRPLRPLKAKYDRDSYTRAIGRACEAAFPPPAPLARLAGETAKAWAARLDAGQKAGLAEWRRARRWSPNQLRHAFATRVRKDHGLEAAQVLLGHSSADVTQVYAERDADLAVSVAALIG